MVCSPAYDRHKDLEAAYDQLLRYRNALESPPLLVLCDLDRIIIRTNFTGTVSATHEIPLEALAEPRNIEIVRAVFHNPDTLRPGRTSAAVTQDAAVRIGEIAASMRERGLDPAVVAHFLDRIVFCLFAEDARLLPDMVFSRIVSKSGGDPARFGKTLGMLFDAMAAGGDFGLETIRHFNGNLFDDPPSPGGYGATSRTIPALTDDDVKRFAAAASLDWSAVDPSIFGTLFERGLDPAKRSQLGAHFTGREDIELVVDAVVMAPLRREWEETKAIIEKLLATGKKTGVGNREPGIEIKTSSDSRLPIAGSRLRKARGEADSILHQFLTRLREIKILDPACGSGNFLYVALLRLKDLEREAAITFTSEHGLSAYLPGVGPWQLYGIEINPYAHDLAQMTVWIGWLQWIRANGFGFPADPILRSLSGNIRLMDAVLGSRESGIGSRESENGKPETADGKQDLQGSGRLAGSDGTGCGDLSINQNVAGCRALRVDLTSPAVVGVGPGEHCGGLRAGAYGRVSSPPVHGAGIVAGTGDASGSGETPDLCDARNTDQRADFAGARWHDAQQVDTGDQGQGLTPTPDSRLPIPAEPEWPTVDFIIGNPPFLGDKLMRRELGDAYVDRLRALYADRIPGQSDLCCYWFEKARSHIAAGKCKRAGLLATQGIRGGANREVLKRIKDTGGIFWAESDRPWILNGANVHVSMIGFDGGEEKTRSLDGKAVATINSNLTSTVDFASAESLLQNAMFSFIGTTKGGSFDISDREAQALLSQCPNPHGRPNSNVLKPILNGLDILRRGAQRWVIDNEDRTQPEASMYESPHRLVIERVKPSRDNNRNKWLKENWWKLQRVRTEMRTAISALPRFLATPRVAKHRLFLWFSWPTVTDDQTVVFARADDYFFGVLHSRFHEVWALAQGTQLREKESGFRYTPTTCFDPFPFPESHPERDAAIAAAAEELNALRENWLNPPEWTRTETIEFPGTVGGPWDRFIVSGSAHPLPIPDSRLPIPVLIGTVRYPRLVPRDADCAARLKDRTLTKLYNARPAWLADCHARLDAAVAAAYGWPADLTDDAILERLLALNLERAGA